MIRSRWRGPGFAVALFFAFKVALGAAILIASARWMTVADFAIFSQLLILIAYLASIGTAGVQNGLIRQIAAADGDAVAIAREVRAALSIWAGVVLLALVGASLLRDHISVLLIGTDAVGWAVPWLTLLAMWSGLGQLLCSILTGTSRAATALSAQAVGLAGGTVPALLLLHNGMPAAAALAFTGGQGVTTLIAGSRILDVLAGAWRSREPVRTEIVRLTGFSGAFLATASIMPLTLIALRSVYRTSFGLDALGYWLAANRISDVNTQLLGLYMVQAFLPVMAKAPAEQQRRLAIRTAIGAACVMVLPLLVFLTAPSLFVRIFLSAKFLPATTFFAAYLLGDILRVGAATASFTALAHARLKLYVGIEAVAALSMSIFVISLSWAGQSDAPAIGYVATYAIIFIAAGLLARRVFRAPLR
jgi:O-antigen/teichoic acid export membrane protein